MQYRANESEGRNRTTMSEESAWRSARHSGMRHADVAALRRRLAWCNVSHGDNKARSAFQRLAAPVVDIFSLPHVA